MQRHFKAEFRDRHIHASNPSLQLPSDISDYRLAAERLRELGMRRNRQREDTSGFVTLKEFMLSRQEEERRQNSRTTQRLHPAGNNEGAFTFPRRRLETKLTREPHRLKPSNLALVLQYVSGTFPDFLAKVLGISTSPFS
jgi:hypothetical protein